MPDPVLLVSELGIGMGHVQRLLQIGSALKNQGFAPVLAHRELWVCLEQCRAAGIPAVQAPVHRSQVPPGQFTIRSYADMSAACGFQTVDGLWPSIMGWTALIDLIRPKLILADYSPLVSLAAFDRCPLVAIGDGFVLPPPHLARMPILRPNGTEMADEDTQLDNAATVQKRLGRRSPASLPALIGGQAHVVCTYPELDLYADARLQEAEGSLLPDMQVLGPASQPRIFLYLTATQRITSSAVQAAIATRLPVEAYIRDSGPELRQELRHQGVIVHDAAPFLPEALERCSLLVHHGGIGTLENGLAAGRPQLLVPLHFEQTLNAGNAVRRGLALSIEKDDTVASLAEKAHDLATGKRSLSGLPQTALNIAARDPGAALRSVVAACTALRCA